ncbi:MAG TPA: hypothetical protein VK866_02775, partial [Acidimicrobiales bacterium]|nr:hypothetical protein [Acidimicrobiales bacterium]
MLIDERTEATFVPGHHGRDGVLALWGDAAADRERRSGRVDAEPVELVVRAGSQVRLRSVPARRVPVGLAIEALASLPAAAEVTPSVRAWSVATPVALDLVARGRLAPSVAADGTDTWRVGPLDLDDHARIVALADALPAAAHCVPVTAGPPRR